MSSRFAIVCALSVILTVFSTGCIPASIIESFLTPAQQVQLPSDDPPEPAIDGWQPPTPYPPLLPARDGQAAPTRDQQLWALGTCAILTERDRFSHEVLGGLELHEADIQGYRDMLASWWNIHSRDDLLRTLEWIEDGGHRLEFDRIAFLISDASPSELEEMRGTVANDAQLSHALEVVIRYRDDPAETSISGWDFSRYVSLCGWGYVSGYITEEEAWQKIMPVARLLQETFDSWEHMGANYLIGREFWSISETERTGGEIRAAYDRLLSEAHSPWVKIPWDLDLESIVE